MARDGLGLTPQSVDTNFAIYVRSPPGGSKLSTKIVLICEIFSARRGIETQMMEKLPEVSNDKVNATKKVDITKNNKSNKEKNRKERKKKKDPLAEWQAALGPYPVVSPGTREASFVHAISSAGVAHAVTRSCSSGELENCGCDRSLRGMSPEGFQVSGVSAPFTA